MLHSVYTENCISVRPLNTLIRLLHSFRKFVVCNEL